MLVFIDRVRLGGGRWNRLVDGLRRLPEYRAGLDKAPAEKKVVEIKEAAK